MVYNPYFFKEFMLVFREKTDGYRAKIFHGQALLLFLDFICSNVYVYTTLFPASFACYAYWRDSPCKRTDFLMLSLPCY